ncbi:unnamed protein product [Prunus armeniaca]
MPLSPMHNTLLDPRSQVDLNSRVDQLTQKVDEQNNLIGQLLRQINLNHLTLDPVTRKGGHTSMLASSSRGPRLVRQGQTGRGESEIVQTRRRQL